MLSFRYKQNTSNMKVCGLVVTFVVLALAVSYVKSDEEDRSELCICPRIYKPVCASNGVTYSSACEFSCEAKKIRRLGSHDVLKIIKESAC